MNGLALDSFRSLLLQLNQKVLRVGLWLLTIRDVQGVSECPKHQSKNSGHTMKYTRVICALALTLAACSFNFNPVNAQTDVVAFWGFQNTFGFDDGADGPNMQDHLADVDNTVSGGANLQTYLGDASDLDDNGGGGFTTYTSPVSGVTYGASRTVKWDDLAGPGDDFSIATQTVFDIDFNDGLGPVSGEDFGNDALVYIVLDGTGFQDFQIRFDIEGTPLDPDPGIDPVTGLPEIPESFLPDEFDIFYRVAGPGGVWFRDYNNFDLTFLPVDPANPDNQAGDTGGYVPLNAALDNASQIEIIFNDFDNNGNGEMELDNIEIVANQVSVVPEPTSTSLFLVAGLGCLGLRRRS
jgi:hypothetical protein